MSFQDILDRSVDEIEEPGTLPSGTWRFQIISGKLKEGTRDNGPEAEALFTLKPLEPLDDVNEVELEAFGEQLDGTRAFHKIAIWDRRSEWDVIRFLNTAGVELEQGAKLGDSVAASKNYEVTAYVTHAENEKDPEHPYVNLSSFQSAA
jgi:hypothetical protein